MEKGINNFDWLKVNIKVFKYFYAPNNQIKTTVYMHQTKSFM